MKVDKFSFKNFKFVEEMSEETPCFSADLYENGKLVAHVSNRGHGGCNEVRPAKGLTHKDVEHLMDFDTDCEIMQLAEETNFIKKNQSKAFVLKKGDKYYTSKFPMPVTSLKRANNYSEWLKKQKELFKKDGFELLNTNL